MIIKGVALEEIRTKKGAFVYKVLVKDENMQKVISIMTKKEHPLNKDSDWNISFGVKLEFEKN